MTTGLRIKIDVTKIQKELLYQGEKGTYLNATVFINDDEDKYGQHGAITQDRNKGDEGDKIFIGNVKKFWSDEKSGGGFQPPESHNHSSVQSPDDGDEIPF